MSYRHILIAPSGVVITADHLVEAALDELRSPILGVLDRERIRAHLVDMGHPDSDPVGGSDVVVLRSPVVFLYAGLGMGTRDIPWVGVIDDWGMTKRRPINWKAWALYGRSPIYGPMVVKPDSPAETIPDDFVKRIAAPIEEWVDEAVLTRMHNIVRESMGL